MAEFFAMGGYAAFVWPSFGVTAVVLAGMWLASVRELRARQAEFDALQVRSGPGRERVSK